MASGNFKTRIDIKPVAEILKRHGLHQGGAVTLKLRDDVERYSNPYIPMKSHYLKDDSISHPNAYSIRYNTPYARYQYHGKVMIGKAPKQVTNKDLKYHGAPKRGAFWDKRMWNDRGKEICNNLEVFIKQYVR